MAVYPGKKLSIPNKEHTIHPYLLRGLKIERNNQVKGILKNYLNLNLELML
jgi:hypothetical protein